MAHEKEREIDFVILISIVLIALANVCQMIGVGSDHWVNTVSEQHGTVGFSGLWQTCANFGMILDSCRYFKWTDVQVSHWFRTVQTMEVLGLVFGLVALLMTCLRNFVGTCHTNNKLRLISVLLLILSFLLVLCGGAVIGALKDVQRAIPLEPTTMYMSWSFGFSIVGCILYLASAIAVVIAN